MTTNLIPGLIVYLLFLISLSIHEWAHGYVAYKFGDPTAAALGRLTLNPLAHVDMVGTVIVPIAMILLAPGFVILGWAKPVPIDPRYFKGRKSVCELLVSLVGPFSNLLLAMFASIIGACSVKYFGGNTAALFGLMAWINIALFVFNLVPIPPLDGGYMLKIVFQISDEIYFRISRCGFLILFVLINTPPFRSILYACMVGTSNLINALLYGLFKTPQGTLLF